MAHLLATTSTLAIIEYWRQKEVAIRSLQTQVFDDWDVRYYPSTVLYVRVLTPHERRLCEYDGDVSVAWYGAFAHRTAELVAVSDDYETLRKQVVAKNVSTRFVH